MPEILLYNVKSGWEQSFMSLQRWKLDSSNGKDTAAVMAQ